MQHRFENIDLTKMRTIGKMNYQNRVNYYKSIMYDTIASRLIEILPYFIKYNNLPKTLSALQIESQLRIGCQDLIIGEDKYNQIVVLGRPVGLVHNFYDYPIVTGIMFTIDKSQRKERSEYRQLTPNNTKDGNYILLRNRYNIAFKTDIEIIQDFAIHLAEIKKSRYSLTLQSNVLTYFKGVDVYNNNTINKLMDDMFEGAPIVKIESNLNINDDFGTMDNAKVIPQMLIALKDEYDNIFNEMLNLIGVLNLGVDKESGVNNIEASANQGFLNTINNIYLTTRQEAFNLLNQRFNLDIKVSVDTLFTNQVRDMIPTDKELENKLGSSIGRGDKNDTLL